MKENLNEQTAEIFLQCDDAKSLKNPNIQDVFLNNIRKDKNQITIFLMNGFQLRGTVKSFDNYVILLESDGKQSMVYKHAVSTIVPAKE